MKIKRRDYISWSQLNTWEKNPNLYYEVYVMNMSHPFTKWMRKGKDLADYLEKEVEDVDDDTKCVGELIPCYKEKEFKMETKVDKINLLGYFDSFDPDELDLYEYKTGKSYTQGKANKLGQLDFYTLMIWLKYNKLPKSIKLIWVETETTNDIVTFTGKIKTFEVKKTMEDVINIIARIKKANEGIKDMWKLVDF